MLWKGEILFCHTSLSAPEVAGSEEKKAKKKVKEANAEQKIFLALFVAKKWYKRGRKMSAVDSARLIRTNSGADRTDAITEHVQNTFYGVHCDVMASQILSGKCRIVV